MRIYMDRCQNCHGEYGNGKGSRADKLSVQPSDFTDAHAMITQTDGELFWKISEGHKPNAVVQEKVELRKSAGSLWISSAHFRKARAGRRLPRPSLFRSARNGAAAK